MAARNGTNGFNGAHSPYVTQEEFLRQSEDISLLKQTTTTIQRDVVALGGNMRTELISISTAVDKLGSKVEERGKTQWPIIIGGIAYIPMLLAGMMWLITTQTANSLNPLTNQLSRLDTLTQQHDRELRDTAAKAESSLRSDEQSRMDRGQINQRILSLEAALALTNTMVRENSAKVNVSLVEVEQQFHAVSNVQNVHLAQQNRLNALLWKKAYGEAYPENIFFPTSIFQDGKNP